MSAEMAAESMEIVTMAVDKHQTTKNYEVSADKHLRHVMKAIIKNTTSL